MAQYYAKPAAMLQQREALADATRRLSAYGDSLTGLQGKLPSAYSGYAAAQDRIKQAAAMLAVHTSTLEAMSRVVGETAEAIAQADANVAAGSQGDTLRFGVAGGAGGALAAGSMIVSGAAPLVSKPVNVKACPGLKQVGRKTGLLSEMKKGVKKAGEGIGKLASGAYNVGKSAVKKAGKTVSALYNEFQEGGKYYKTGQYVKTGAKVLKGGVKVATNIVGLFGTGGASLPIAIVGIANGANDMINAGDDWKHLKNDNMEAYGKYNLLRDKLTESGGIVGEKLFGNKEAGEKMGAALYQTTRMISDLYDTEKLLSGKEPAEYVDDLAGWFGTLNQTNISTIKKMTTYTEAGVKTFDFFKTAAGNADELVEGFGKLGNILTGGIRAGNGTSVAGGGAGSFGGGGSGGGGSRGGAIPFGSGGGGGGSW